MLLKMPTVAFIFKPVGVLCRKDWDCIEIFRFEFNSIHFDFALPRKVNMSDCSQFRTESAWFPHKKAGEGYEK